MLTSFRELARKASRANNFWWRLSGALGDDKRHLMYALIQAVFTVSTLKAPTPFNLVQAVTSLLDALLPHVLLPLAPRLRPLQLLPRLAQRQFCEPLPLLQVLAPVFWLLISFLCSRAALRS